MNSDELAASIGRHINGILDDVASYAAEQVALATAKPGPLTFKSEPVLCAGCLRPLPPGENCPRCPPPEWARKAAPELDWISFEQLDEMMTACGMPTGFISDFATVALAKRLSRLHQQPAEPEDTTPEAARREVSVTGARIEQRHQDDTTTGYHRDGKRCGFTQPTAQNTP